MKIRSKVPILSLMLILGLSAAVQADDLLPIRGLHLGAPGRGDLPLCLKFIREAMPQEGVNLLVMEFDYGYQFKSHPELSSSHSLGEDEVKQIVAACHDAGVKLIPQINCLGHQSWSKHTAELLTVYPEFDETPGCYPENEGIYCRSYCPLHPRVHQVVFDLLDELADACEADAVHVGMDEVFLLAEADCPRCKGKDPAELFAYEVTTLHDHLAEKGRKMWMWGDRFLDGKATGLGEWEGSFNHTEAAIDKVPKDIMICDWHYDQAVPTAPYFALKGFSVLSCPWRKTDVALGELEILRTARRNAGDLLSGRMQGVLHTTWCGLGSFVRAYYGEEDSGRNKSAVESAACFKALFAELRKQ